MAGKPFTGYSKAGVNWENVSKRILPQLIYKGYVLRRERLCSKGLFFVCPKPSVKGGQNIGVSEVRDLIGVLQREKEGSASPIFHLTCIRFPI